MKRPRTDIGRTLLAAEEDKIWGRALLWGIVVVGAAFVAAWFWQDKTWMLVPDDLDASQLALYQTSFTGIAVAVLLIPAVSAFFFRNRALGHWRKWEAFWTVAYVAALVHVGWGIFVYHGADFSEALRLLHVPFVWPALAVLVWWPIDLWLAGRDVDERWWDGGQRIVLHLAVFGALVWATAWEGQTLGAKVAGFALAGAAVASGLDAWGKRGRG